MIHSSCSKPQRGAHPEGAEISALDHVLNGKHTMPADRGIFLDQSWRLPPAICQVTSELYYDGRLEARPANIHQRLQGDSPFAGRGIFYVPVEHAGNQNSSPEEVEAVDRLVNHLLTSRLAFVDNNQHANQLEYKDFLIVAPYNGRWTPSPEEGRPCHWDGGSISGAGGRGRHPVTHQLFA